MSLIRSRRAAAVAGCLALVFGIVAAQSQMAGTTSCNDNEQDTCFGASNDPTSPTGFDTGVMSACPMTEPVSDPIPQDAASACCTEVACECEEAEASFCYLELDVEGVDGLPDITVQLRIWFPPKGVLGRGVVLFGTASGGTSFFTDSIVADVECDLYGVAFALELAARGFIVIDKRWTTGWTGTTAPTRREAARYATLVKYLYEHYHCPGDGAFVAVGISGGSSEIGFALSSYGMEDYIDVAVFLSGPANGDLERSCDDDDDWCHSLFSQLCSTVDWSHCGDPPNCEPPACVFDPSIGGFSEVCEVDDCTDGDPFCHQYQSVAWDPTNGHEFEGTIAIFLVGQGDGKPSTNQLAPTGALAFFDSITSRRHFQVVPDVGHLMHAGDDPENEAARQYILRTIDYYTRPFVGDVDRDGDIDSTDATLVDNDIEAQCTGYCCDDVDNDLVVTEDDADIIDANSMENYLVFSTGSGNCLDDLPTVTSCLGSTCCQSGCPNEDPLPSGSCPSVTDCDCGEPSGTPTCN